MSKAQWIPRIKDLLKEMDAAHDSITLGVADEEMLVKNKRHLISLANDYQQLASLTRGLMAEREELLLKVAEMREALEIISTEECKCYERFDHTHHPDCVIGVASAALFATIPIGESGISGNPHALRCALTYCEQILAVGQAHSSTAVLSLVSTVKLLLLSLVPDSLPAGKSPACLQEAIVAHAALDTALVANWISVKDGDWKQAINDLIAFNVQLASEWQLIEGNPPPDRRIVMLATFRGEVGATEEQRAKDWLNGCGSIRDGVWTVDGRELAPYDRQPSYWMPMPDNPLTALRRCVRSDKPDQIRAEEAFEALELLQILPELEWNERKRYFTADKGATAGDTALEALQAARKAKSNA